MGRRIAVEYVCDRCGVIWLEDFDPNAAQAQQAEEHRSLKVVFDGETLEFKVLCETCHTTCGNYIENIFKDLKRKPGGKKKGEDDAPPSPDPAQVNGSVVSQAASTTTATPAAAARSR